MSLKVTVLRPLPAQGDHSVRVSCFMLLQISSRMSHMYLGQSSQPEGEGAKLNHTGRGCLWWKGQPDGGLGWLRSSQEPAGLEGSWGLDGK